MCARRATERTSVSRLDRHEVDTWADHGERRDRQKRSEPAVLELLQATRVASPQSGTMKTPETEADQEGDANPVH